MIPTPGARPRPGATPESTGRRHERGSTRRSRHTLRARRGSSSTPRRCGVRASHTLAGRSPGFRPGQTPGPNPSRANTQWAESARSRRERQTSPVTVAGAAPEFALDGSTGFPFHPAPDFTGESTCKQQIHSGNAEAARSIPETQPPTPARSQILVAGLPQIPRRIARGERLKSGTRRTRREARRAQRKAREQERVKVKNRFKAYRAAACRWPLERRNRSVRRGT